MNCKITTKRNFKVLINKYKYQNSCKDLEKYIQNFIQSVVRKMKKILQISCIYILNTLFESKL